MYFKPVYIGESKRHIKGEGKEQNKISMSFCLALPFCITYIFPLLKK